jgi:hypothetical protein
MGHSLRLRRHGERLRIEVVCLLLSAVPPQGDGPPEHPPTTFEKTLPHFATRVRHLLAAVLKRWGMEGYREIWPPHEFPLQEYRALGDLFDERSGQTAEPIAES